MSGGRNSCRWHPRNCHEARRRNADPAGRSSRAVLGAAHLLDRTRPPTASGEGCGERGANALRHDGNVATLASTVRQRAGSRGGPQRSRETAARRRNGVTAMDVTAAACGSVNTPAPLSGADLAGQSALPLLGIQTEGMEPWLFIGMPSLAWLSRGPLADADFVQAVAEYHRRWPFDD